MKHETEKKTEKPEAKAEAKAPLKEIKEFHITSLSHDQQQLLQTLIDHHGGGERINLSDVLANLPAALAFLQGLLSGQAEIPAFKVRVLGRKKKVGPIPVVDTD